MIKKNYKYNNKKYYNNIWNKLKLNLYYASELKN